MGILNSLFEAPSVACSVCGAEMPSVEGHIFKNRWYCDTHYREQLKAAEKAGESLSSELASPLPNSYPGTSFSESARGRATPVPVSAYSLAVPWGVAGFLIGAILGMLTRPSVPLLGQLPIGTVLARGANLTGLDTLLKSSAEASFNHVLMWVLISTALGAAIGAFLGYQKRMTTAQVAGGALTPKPIVTATRDDSGAHTPAAFCISCGTKLPDAAIFCPRCGSKRAG